MFALLIKIKFSITVYYRLSLIGYDFYHLFYSLKDVIASVNRLYQVRIIDIAVLCENTHLKHFVFGDTTGTAKVSPRNVFNGKANKFLMFTAFIHVIEYNIYLGKKSKGVNVAVFSSVSCVAVEVK